MYDRCSQGEEAAKRGYPCAQVAVKGSLALVVCLVYLLLIMPSPGLLYLFLQASRGDFSNAATPMSTNGSRGAAVACSQAFENSA